jgi:uncharacterized protein (TIGR03382 family)
MRLATFVAALVGAANPCVAAASSAPHSCISGIFCREETTRAYAGVIESVDGALGVRVEAAAGEDAPALGAFEPVAGLSLPAGGGVARVLVIERKLEGGTYGVLELAGMEADGLHCMCTVASAQEAVEAAVLPVDACETTEHAWMGGCAAEDDGGCAASSGPASSALVVAGLLVLLARRRVGVAR